MLRQLREGDLGRRVVEDVILPGEPLEECLQGRQTAMLRAERHRPAIALAVVEQMPLVTLQDRFGDVLRVPQGSLLTPGNKAPDGHPTRADRVLGVAVHPHPLKVRIHVADERLPGEWISTPSLRTGRLRPHRFAVFQALALARHGYTSAAATEGCG